MWRDSVVDIKIRNIFVELPGPVHLQLAPCILGCRSHKLTGANDFCISREALCQLALLVKESKWE